MNEPRKLNIGEARKAPAAGQEQQTVSAEELLAALPAADAAQQGAAAPRAVRQPTAPGAPRQVDTYAAARRDAQASAEESARVRRTHQLPRISHTRELTPEERRAIALGLNRKGKEEPAQPAQPAAAQPTGPQPARTVRRTIKTTAASGKPVQPTPAAPAAPVIPAAPVPPAAPAAPAQPPQARRAAPQNTEQPTRRKVYDVTQDGDFEQDGRAHSIAQLYPPAHKEKKAEKGKAKAEPTKGKKGKRGDAGAKKKKKKIRWWKVLLVIVLILALIFGALYMLISYAIAPGSSGIGGTGLSVNNMFSTPKEYQGKELNLLVVGIDRSGEDGKPSDDPNVNDGNTDMILYVHFNNETGEMKMLQIPRDYMVTTSKSVSGNYCLNNVAWTQATQAGTLNMDALVQQVSTMFQIPIDGYISLRMEMLVKMVDALGPIELYIPQDMSYNGSKLEKGYRFLTGEQVEYFLRDRHSFATSDFGRLENQRQFYAAIFRRLKNMGSIWEVAKIAPAILYYMETNLPLNDLIGLAVSMLKIESSKIMICRMPGYMMGSRNYWDGRGTYEYNSKSVVYPARQQAADLLNEYFRENTGPVNASALQLCEPTSDALGAFGVKSEMSLMPAAIQFMQEITNQQDDAKVNDNPDGLSYIDYVDPTPEPSPAA